ncbi:cell wall protein IFF6-like isoform X1 [Haliotis rubra]|uniref:cell wall protein IFF6-like isoform X1 n=1 Tax=Haliotis rubra TaxID=36100 RepID=UPI001EE5A7F2|nr:cell wall protein IFF6-like isoform X1 [Haliotis rubra]
MVQTSLDTIEMWSDMTKNIQGATEALNNVIKDKAGEVTGSSRNLSDQAQGLAESATSIVENPTLNRVADMSDISLVIKKMSGTVGHLSTTFNSLVEDMSADIQKNITSFSDMLIKAGEDSGLFRFIKEAGHEICELLKKILAIIHFVKEKIKKFLEVFNGLIDKVFTFLGKIVSVIQDVLGLDMELMKEALKNGTIRAADVKAGNVNFALSSEVKTKSSTVVSGAKVTAGNVSAVGKVVDNSRSGHIEVAAVDVKAGNADVALMREGKIKRNLAYLKGANINAGNARATLVDDREIDSAVVGASAAEVNVGNVEAFGLGRKGTHRHTTAQPSFSAGNVAIGVRRSRGTNIKAGPQFSAGNIDLTIGAPSVSNFLNQFRPGHGFANFTIPFLGGGAEEAGGKSNGGKGNEMPLETAGESTYGLPRDTVEFGDRLPQHEDTGTGGVHSGSNKNGATGTDPVPVPGSGPSPGSGGRGKSTSGASAGGTGKGTGRSNTQESHSRISTASNTHNFGTEKGKDSQTCKRGQTGQTSISISSSNSLLNESSDSPFSPKQDSRGKPLGESGESKGVSNSLGSGVHKSGDGIGNTPEEDYQTTVASIVRREVYQKSGKKPKKDPKKETRADEKDKKYSKEELRRALLKEGQEELGSSVEAGEGCTGVGKETKATKKTHIKPKAKPWGEHGNIHGFSTLGTECGKEVKKLGNRIYGFGDE